MKGKSEHKNSVPKVNSVKRDLLNFAGLVAIIVIANYILSFFYGRFDLTADKRHSLSPNTITLLEDENRLNDPIFLKIYLAGDLPADIKKISNAIEEKLDEFANYAGDKIQYEFIDPNGEDDPAFNLEVQKNIYQDGIRPCDIQILKSGQMEVKTVWPGAIIEYKGLTADRIQFFNKRILYSNEDARGLADRTINNLEYQLISAIRRVTAKNKQTVAFLQGHNELDAWQTAEVRGGLARYYFTEDVEIAGKLNALDDVDALIIAQPKLAFNEKDKFIIDQFVMNGGKVLWFIDPIDVNRDSLYLTGETFGVSANLNIEKDMIYKYGVRLNSNTIIDKDCAPTYIPGHPLEVLDWYFYPNLQRSSHPITKNIDPVKAEYASSIDLVNSENTAITKSVLLHSSFNSKAFKAPVRINFGIVNVEPKFNSSAGEAEFPVAVMLEGQFTSAFENRVPEVLSQSPDFTMRNKSDSTKMLVVSDGDIIRNEVDTKVQDGQILYKAIPMEMDVFGVQNANGSPKYVYGNKDFVLNCIDYMLDDFSLIDVRAKTITMRVLDMQKINEEKDFWKFLNILFPILFIILLNIVQHIIRLRKYAR